MRSIRILIVLMLAVVGLGLGGCQASAPQKTGFLSEYNNLTRVSDTSHRYVAPDGVLAGYDRFIVEPIQVYFHGDLTKVPRSELKDLAVYFRGAIISALSDSYTAVTTPGPRTARIRIALTDVKKSTWWANLNPGSKLSGAGTGEAAMEGELLDSVTGEQLAALVEAQRGNQLELDMFSEYDDARDVIDDWADRIRQRLDEAHGR